MRTSFKRRRSPQFVDPAALINSPQISTTAYHAAWSARFGFVPASSLTGYLGVTGYVETVGGTENPRGADKVHLLPTRSSVP